MREGFCNLKNQYGFCLYFSFGHSYNSLCGKYKVTPTKKGFIVKENK